MDEILKNHKVVICGGTGGVGKTTIAASLGVRAATLGLKTLVLTIDPARRLKSALGLESLDEVKKVEGNFGEGELYASMIHFKKVFDGFVRSMAPSEAVAEKLLNNKLYHQLSTNLGGSQEYTSLERLYEAVNVEDYDLIILDTPPSQHAIDFLKAPQKFYALFQSSVFNWFLAPSGKDQNILSRIIHKGTQTVFRSLESLTGAEFFKELTEFFSAIQDWREHVQSHSAEIHRLLTSDRTGFVLVTSFDKVKIDESKRFQAELARGGYNLVSVIVNRAFPSFGLSEQTESGQSPVEQKLFGYYDELYRYYQRQLQLCVDYEESVGKQALFVRLPDYNTEINDIESLKTLGNRISEHASMS